MTSKFRRYAVSVLTYILVFNMIFAVGCKKQPQQDQFFAKVDEQAKSSIGNSPTQAPRNIEYSSSKISDVDRLLTTLQSKKELPKMKITLQMYDTNIVSVIRAMARAANQNVIISSSIPGVISHNFLKDMQNTPINQIDSPNNQNNSTNRPRNTNGKVNNEELKVSINVYESPWDEAFISLLTANKLTYEIEGETIRVMNLDDVKAQNEIREQKNKTAKFNLQSKYLEEFDTCKIEINYSDIDKIYKSVATLCGQSVSDGKGGSGNDSSGSNQSNTSSGAGSDNSSSYDSDDSNSSSSSPSSTSSSSSGSSSSIKTQLACGVIADKDSNSLIIHGAPSDLKKIIKVVERIDRPPYQVRLKAYIVETNRTTAQQLGVQWGGILKGSNFQLSPAQAGTINSIYTQNRTATTNHSITTTLDSTGAPTGTVIKSSSTSGGNAATDILNTFTPIFGGGSAGQGFGLNYPASLVSSATGLGASGTGINFLFGEIGETALELQLTALAEENKVKILASPVITTIENQKASVENGKDIPFQTSSGLQGTNVQWKAATLKLEMTPHVVKDSALKMQIMVQDDQVDNNKSNWVQNNPPIYRRQTRSNLIVDDGDTIVISGLTRDVLSDGQTGVPYLSDIPVLGWAFKAKAKEYERNQILIFITPTILAQKELPRAGQPTKNSNDFETGAAKIKEDEGELFYDIISNN